MVIASLPVGVAVSLVDDNEFELEARHLAQLICGNILVPSVALAPLKLDAFSWLPFAKETLRSCHEEILAKLSLVDY